MNYPDDWKRKQLKDIGYIQMCRRIFQHQTSTSGEIPFYKISTFGGKADVYITRKLYEEYRDKYPYPQKGDILLSAAGTIGRTVIFNGEDAYFQDSNIVWLNVNKKFIDTRYLYWFYLSNPWHSLEGTTIQRLYNKTILDTEIYLPPIPEQTAIATALSDMDSLIDSLRQLIAKKKNIRQGAMQELLTGKRRLPGFEGEWELTNIAENFRIKARIGWQGLTTKEYLDDGFSYLITGTDFVNGYIKWQGCHYVSQERYKQDSNIQIINEDILVTKDGTIGKVAFVDNLNKPATLNSGVFVVRPKNNTHSAKFLYYILSSYVFREFLEKLSAGSTIVHLYQKDFIKFGFLIPTSVSEQEMIAQYLYDMDEEIRSLESKLQKYENIKKGMMEKLLTGQIRLV